MSASKSNISNWVALLCFVAILAIAYFFINPYISNLKEASVNLDAKTKEVAETKQKIIVLNGLQSQFTSSSATIKRLGLAVPSTDMMPEIIVELDSMAAGSGMKVNSIQPGKDSVKGAIPVTVTLEGDYNGFNSFLTKMEKNIRPMNIKTINVATATKESTAVRFTLNLEILKVQ